MLGGYYLFIMTEDDVEVSDGADEELAGHYATHESGANDRNTVGMHSTSKLLQLRW